MTVRVERPEALTEAAAELGLTDVPSTLIVAGGAGGMSDDESARAEPVFSEVLAPLAEETQSAVIDGGTDFGVMRLMGRARAATGATFPLVGVVPVELARELEPNHTHFLLVPGDCWGDEVPWLVDLARTLSNRSALVVVNGGEIARRDAAACTDAGYAGFAVTGSGRAADELAAEGVLRPLPLDDRDALRAALAASLDGRP